MVFFDSSSLSYSSFSGEVASVSGGVVSQCIVLSDDTGGYSLTMCQRSLTATKITEMPGMIIRPPLQPEAAVSAQRLERENTLRANRNISRKIWFTVVSILKSFFIAILPFLIFRLNIVLSSGEFLDLFRKGSSRGNLMEERERDESSIRPLSKFGGWTRSSGSHAYGSKLHRTFTGSHYTSHLNQIPILI